MSCIEIALVDDGMGVTFCISSAAEHLLALSDRRNEQLFLLKVTYFVGKYALSSASEGRPGPSP